MYNLYQQLLRNRFIIFVLFLALLSFVALFLAETYLALAPRVSDVIRGFSMALLTSGVVGFIFEYLTHNEFTKVIQITVRDEIKLLEQTLMGSTEENSSLFKFWNHLISEGITIVIPQDETGTEPLVRAADISAALHLYRGLLNFTLLDRNDNIKINYVSKQNLKHNICDFDNHIIIIGAPGANPLSTLALDQFHGNNPNTQLVKTGYVFTVKPSKTPDYIDNNPYIIKANDEKTALIELHKGNVIKRYERYLSHHIDGISHDCCLLEHGKIECDGEHHSKTVLVVAGHSRFSTLDGVNFIISNSAWCNDIMERNTPSATVLKTSISTAYGRTVGVAQSPQSILKNDNSN